MQADRANRVLAFISGIPDGPRNFPQKILKLFSQHYQVSKSLFFPFFSEAVYWEPPVKRTSLNNFIALNIHAHHLKAYTDHYYKKDIFNARRIAPVLSNRKAIRVVDIMPLEKYEQTEHHFYLNSTGLYYQACIFLKHQNRNIASVNLFRPREEGDFTVGEMADFEALSDFLSRGYVAALFRTSYHMLQSAFKQTFDGLTMGAVLLDSYLMVLQANPAAREISEKVMSQLPEKDDFFQKSLRYVDSEHAPVQTMCNAFGAQLLSGEPLPISPLAGAKLHPRSNTLSVDDIMGNVKTLYLVLLDLSRPQGKELSGAPAHPLTRRETEILELVAAGLSNEKIAGELGMSVYTVRTHISNIYKKFGVNNKVSLLLKING